jgi:hypothetical protein
MLPSYKSSSTCPSCNSNFPLVHPPAISFIHPGYYPPFYIPGHCNSTTKMTATKALKPVFSEEAASQEYAASLDAADPLREFRDQFIIPSKANLATKKLAKPGKLILYAPGVT